MYKGKIYIIHPKAREILGVRSYQTIEELPEVPDLAIIILSKSIDVIFERLGKFGVKCVAIESEIDKESNGANVMDQVDLIAKKYGMVYMGPAMIGLINYEGGFTTSIIPVRQHIMKTHKNLQGGVSYLAQSGGLAGALGWWMPSQKLPISKAIHLGESRGVRDANIIEFFAADETTKVISLFLKDISDELLEAVRKIAPIKPILFFFIGKDETRELELKKAGGIEVSNYIELFEIAKVFLWCSEPKGSRLGIIGPSSGAIYILVKEMRKNNLSLAKLTSESRKTILEKVGGSTCNLGNPVDYWPPEKFVGTKICSIYNTSSQVLLSDASVDGLVLALEFFVEIEFDFGIFKKIKELYPDKPIITVLIHAEKEGLKRVINQATELKIPVFDNEIERAVRSYRLLYDYYSKIKKK